MSIYCTGDCHGEDDCINKFSSRKWKDGRQLTSDDSILIAGDFGLIFKNVPSNAEKWWLNWLSERKWTTLIVDGNHENFPLLYSYPQKEWNGGMVGVIAPNILHLRRGYVYTIEGKKFFIFGGARSEDKQDRIEHIYWWREEEPNYGEMLRGKENLEACGNAVDYIISHTAPFSIISAYKNELNRRTIEQYNLVKYFDSILENVSFKKWIFGHFHQDKKLNEKFTAVYKKIKLLEDL